MQLITSKILTELDNQLNFIKSESNNSIQNAELSIQTIIKSIEKLKIFIIKYKFQNQKEEITFFKKIKPQFVSRLLLASFIYNTETKRPNGSGQNVRSFLEDELKKLHAFYENNIEFYKYYRTGSDHLDNQLFIRGKYDIKINLDNLHGVIDERFSTHQDYLVAQIIANNQMEDYLQKEIELLDNDTKQIANSNKNSSLNWTAPKVAIIELLYAFHADGCFNNGNANISQIATVFESVFNIELSQFSRTFLEINSRKLGRTKYLDSLKVKLINKMNESNPDS
jgi:hypothetical protein